MVEKCPCLILAVPFLLKRICITVARGFIYYFKRVTEPLVLVINIAVKIERLHVVMKCLLFTCIDEGGDLDTPCGVIKQVRIKHKF